MGPDHPLALLAQARRDVRAAMERDPAARSVLTVLICYPGVHAVLGHRVNHWLWHRGKLLARTLSEVNRILTGADIHPAASLGSGVFIDHATGVVIGETAQVGADVTIYQGVTIGGTSLERTKRHPTIGDRVTLGAGAKILGPITIGDDVKIGANAVVLRPAPAGSVVVGVPGQIVSRDSRGRAAARAHPADGQLPDPLGAGLESLLTRVDRLESAANQSNGHPIRPPEAGIWHGEDFSI